MKKKYDEMKIIEINNRENQSENLRRDSGQLSSFLPSSTCIKHTCPAWLWPASTTGCHHSPHCLCCSRAEHCHYLPSSLLYVRLAALCLPPFSPVPFMGGHLCCASWLTSPIPANYLYLAHRYRATLPTCLHLAPRVADGRHGTTARRVSRGDSTAGAASRSLSMAVST